MRPSHAALLTAVFLSACQSPAARPQGPPRSFRFDHFHDSPEIAAVFADMAARAPDWFEAASLGTSVQGRPIPVLRISNERSERPKLRLWIDGAIHGGELASAEPVLGFAEQLRRRIAAGQPPAFLDRVELVLVPVINVDGRSLALAGPYRNQRRNLRPVDDDGDGRKDEDFPQDLNGDGHISEMRSLAKEPLGVEALDQDGDGKRGEDAPGGTDLNRNYPVTERGRSSTREPETRAVMRFFESNSDIALAVSFHTSANVLVPPSVAIREADRPLFDQLFEIYKKQTGFRIFDTNPKIFHDLSIDWFYQERAVPAFVIELSLLDKVETPAPGDSGFKVFEHPQLGAVEILERGPDYLGYQQRILGQMKEQIVLYKALLFELAEWVAKRPLKRGG